MFRRLCGSLLLIGLLIGAAVLVAPGADAQSVPVLESNDYAPLHVVEADDPCPVGYSDAGPTGRFGGERWCLPPGLLTMVTSAPGCEAVLAELGVAVFVEPVCASFGWVLQAGEQCRAPGVRTQHAAGEVCLGPWYRRAGTAGDFHTPICIEDGLVQSSTGLAGLGVGSAFFAADGTSYVITTGGPTCSFNCYDGHDANCDGVLGDYCSVELDLKKASDVATCLAAMPAEAGAATAVVTIGAPAKAATDTSATTDLAHTGPTDALPSFAISMLGAGAVLHGLGRQLRQRASE